jgi:hypothetical protein
MPKKKTNPGATVSCGGGRKLSISSFKSTEQLVAEAKRAIQKHSRVLGGLTGTNKRKLSEAEKEVEHKKSKEAHRAQRARIKALKPLEHPVDKKIIAYWGENQQRFRNRNEFYLVAPKELKLPTEVIKLRFHVLIEAGMIEFKTTTSTKKTTPKAHLADNLKVYLSVAERKIVRDSRFASMARRELIREVRRIGKANNPGALKQINEALLVYRAKTGNDVNKFKVEVRGK